MATIAAGTQIAKTTLSAAITAASQTYVQLNSLTLTVGSYTTVTAKNPQWGLKIDDEIMEITALGSGTTVNVTRGACGTAAALHGNGQTVWAAPLNDLPGVNPVMSGAAPVRLTYETVPIGSVAYASAGNAVTVTAGSIYYADLYVAQDFVATGAGVLNAVVTSANNMIVALYDKAGNFVTSSATAGSASSGNNAFQTRAFSPGPVFLPAGEYYLALQANNTGTTMMMIAASTFISTKSGSQTGTFGTLPASLNAVPTSWSSNTGPIGYIY